MHFNFSRIFMHQLISVSSWFEKLLIEPFESIVSSIRFRFLMIAFRNPSSLDLFIIWAFSSSLFIVNRSRFTDFRFVFALVSILDGLRLLVKSVFTFFNSTRTRTGSLFSIRHSWMYFISDRVAFMGKYSSKPCILSKYLKANSNFWINNVIQC